MLLVLTAVMTWLVLYPGPFMRDLMKLYDIPDMDFKMLLVALAAVNFLMCFFVEVSEDAKKNLSIKKRLSMILVLKLFSD